jgi:hypothetical protein
MTSTRKLKRILRKRAGDHVDFIQGLVSKSDTMSQLHVRQYLSLHQSDCLSYTVA